MSNKTILFADDSATMRTIMEKTFLAEPFDVVTVPSGEAAIQQAKQLRPSVVIVDAGMAGVSGYDVCRAVRDDAAIGHIPLIVMSGVSSLYDENRGESVGVTEHVKKPFDTTQLIDLVGELAALAPEIEAIPELEEEVMPLSEPPEPIASLEELAEDTAKEPPGSILPEVEIETEMEEPSIEATDEVSIDEPPVHVTRTGTQEFGSPAFMKETAPPRSAMSAVTEQPSAEEESEYGEVALGVAEPESLPAEDVAPIELSTPKPEEQSEQFQVGTLAELAQLDGQARPIAPESSDDAIDLARSQETEPVVSVETPPAEPQTVQSVSIPAVTQPAPTASERFADSNVADVVKEHVDGAAKDVAAGIDGISVEQAEAIQTLTREVIERVVWEVVPDLAEVIIKEELAKLLEE